GVDLRLYHNAGGSIIQELAIALATGNEWIARLTDLEVPAGVVASHLHFTFAVGSNYFPEIAKLRAFRLLWEQVTGQYLDEEDGKARAYIHAETSGWNKTLYDAHNNILRSTTEALSAVIGGCDSLTVRPFDEPLHTPGAFSRRIARNSQLILREEAYADKVVDPAAGSYYIETLTDKIAEKAWSEFQEIEKLGGMMKALEQRYIQKEIDKWRRQRDRDIAMRNRVFVGVNQHPNPDEQIDENYHDDRPIFSLHSSNDKEFKGTQQNLAEVLEKQLGEGASVGDVLSLLYQPEKQGTEALSPYRGSQHFEELRLAVERASKTPKVLTVPLGDRKLRSARASFAAGFFGSAGYHIINPVGFTSIDEAMDTVREHSPEIAVLCSSDIEYQSLAVPFCKALQKLPEKPIAVLAGYPEQQIEQYRKAGIVTFIHRNSNILETLIDFHTKLGILNRE
ncbi:MAG: methylmalonyl-CoA mutase family protein, partial [Balneolaceae bacterium]